MARGYGAPEFAGLATLGAAGSLRGRPWGLPLLLGGALLAAHHHPMALGLLPAWALFCASAWRAAGRLGRAGSLAWVVVGVGLPIAGIASLGLAVEHLEPYHLRMAAVPIAVAASLGWARFGPAPVIVAGIAWPSCR